MIGIISDKGEKHTQAPDVSTCRESYQVHSSQGKPGLEKLYQRASQPQVGPPEGHEVIAQVGLGFLS